MLNWYRIERILGRGGFGVIYLATDTNLDHLVAVKEYIPSDIARRDGDSRVLPITEEHGDMYRWGLERFIKEARNLVRFKHPNIVRVMSVFQENNTAYMVMEFEEGQDLRRHLKLPGSNSEAALKELILPISEGLAEVHRHSFIHRDIKPANILVRKNGSPVLLDFGSARNASKYTAQGLTALVSIGYAPLEQYNDESDEQQGPWTDIYALGGVLYYALTGNDPVDSARRGSALFNGGKDPLIAASVIGKGQYSDAFLNAIDWALQFRIADRPQSLVDWVPALLSNTPAEELPHRDSVYLPPGLAVNDIADVSGSDLLRGPSTDEFSDATILSARSVAYPSQSGDSASATADRIFPINTDRSAVQTRSPTKRRSPLKSIFLLATALAVTTGGSWLVFQRDAALPRTNTADSTTADLQASESDAGTVNSAQPDMNLSEADGTADDSNGEDSTVSAPVHEPADGQNQDQAQSADAIEQVQDVVQIPLADETRGIGESPGVDEARDMDEGRTVAITPPVADETFAIVESLAADESRAVVTGSSEEAARLAEIEEDTAQRVTQAKAAGLARVQEVARKAEIQRKQTAAIAGAQLAMDEGRLDEAGRLLEEAAGYRLGDLQIAELSQQLDRAISEAQRPVSDAGFDSVMQRFDELRQAIENKDIEAMEALTSGTEQHVLFKQLMQRFESLVIDISDIRVRNADKSISANLRIRSMVRENGDRATPSETYRDRELISRRVNGEWSIIHW
ncbi:MAG: protein kinase [Granulosicoccus sp.]